MTQQRIKTKYSAVGHLKLVGLRRHRSNLVINGEIFICDVSAYTGEAGRWCGGDRGLLARCLLLEAPLKMRLGRLQSVVLPQLPGTVDSELSW